MFSSLFPLFLYTDSEVIYRNSDGHVIKFNILTNETEIVLTNTTFVSRYCIKLFGFHSVNAIIMIVSANSIYLLLSVSLFLSF